MMQQVATLELMQRIIRSKICTSCFLRPKGTESMGPMDPRPCEPICQIFINLPQLKKISEHTKSDDMAVYEEAIGEMICQVCEITPDSGDYCGMRTTQQCPLSRYSRDVVEALEEVLIVKKRL